MKEKLRWLIDGAIFGSAILMMMFLILQLTPPQVWQ